MVPVALSRSLRRCRDRRSIARPAPCTTLKRPARMAGLLPDARLIAILAIPSIGAYSNYWLNRMRGREPLEFAEAIEAEPERLVRGLRSAAATPAWIGAGSWCSCGACASTVRGSRCASSRWRTGIVHEAYRRILGFLGIDEAFAPAKLEEPVNHHVAFRAPGLRKTIRRRPAPARLVAGVLNTRRSAYPPMRPELRAELAQRFKEDNAALADWLGRDLSDWSRLHCARPAEEGRKRTQERQSI